MGPSLEHSAPAPRPRTLRQARLVGQKGKTRRHGGVQRAFVRVKALGLVGKPDLAKIAKQLRQERQAQTQDYKRAVAMAAHAARLRKLGVLKAGPVFGANSRTTRKLQLKRSQMFVLRRVQHLDEDARLLSISDHIVKQGLTLRESLAFARNAARCDAAQSRDTTIMANESLDKYRATVGATMLRELCAAVPQFDQRGLRLRPEPVGSCEVFSLVAPDKDLVSKTVACAQKASKVTNLPFALEQDWMELNKLVQAADCPALPPNVSESVSKCYTAGMCLCSGSGIKLDAIASGFLRLMKRVFPKSSEHYTTLLNGGVVVRISGEPDSDDLDAVVAMECPFPDEFYHIGLQYLKPYRPTFLRVVAEEGGEEDLVGGFRVLHAQACWVRLINMYWHLGNEIANYHRVLD